MSLETEPSLGGTAGAPTTHCLLLRQEKTPHAATNGEREASPSDASECVPVTGNRLTRRGAAADGSAGVGVDDNGTQTGTDAPRGGLRPSESWETCSSTSSGYSEGSLRGEEEELLLPPEDSDGDACVGCGHDDFPFCDCLSQAVGKRHKSSLRYGSPRGERRRRRGYIGPSIIAFRDAGLEVFDETEESDFQESETDTDYAAGLESDVEGAVGYAESAPEDPPSAGLLAPPGTALPGIRRASIVTCDSRTGSIQTTPDPVKLAVFGADGVGKSALIVRLLTGRFIGEYDPTMEAVYSYQFPLPGHDLPLQVMDTAGQVEVVEEGRERQVSWGEGFLLVFSLVSHASFLALAHLRRVILELTPGPPRPMVLVGNKADLSHARQVTDREIRDLADCWGCDYFEVAAPEPWEVVVRPFTALYQAVLETRASH